MVDGNTTTPTSPPAKGHEGMAAGLTVFFLLLVIIACVIVFKYCSKVRKKLQLGHRRSQKKEDCTESPVADSQQYTSIGREQPVAQSPIYENLTTGAAGYNRQTVDQSRPPSLAEEALYLQCDSPDEAIYCNDPACNLSILYEESNEEDVYIVPDSC